MTAKSTGSNILRAALSAATAAVLLLVLAQAGSAAPAIVERESTGDAPADIQAQVDAFRADLGGSNNGAGNTFPDGRREIGWDGVPDNLSAPNNMPADLFRNRGAVFSAPGSGFQVSADSDNPTNTPVRFGNFDPAFASTFSAFSPERLFTALGSTVTEVRFFLPGTATPATVDGFGAVFTDVDLAASSEIEYLGVDDEVLFEQRVPAEPGNGTLSFAGATFDTARVAGVRITSGTPVAPDQAQADDDLVVMDDFIYGEPQEIEEPPTIEPISPEPDSETSDRTPTIEAKVTDDETDLAKADIKLSLDGKSRNFDYDASTDTLSFTPKKRLAPGEHEVTVEARDEAGLAATESWTFEVLKK